MTVPAVKDLIHEVSTSTGTGNLTVAAVTGLRRGSDAFGTGDNGAANPVMFIYSRSADEWEIVPCYWADANTLVRGTTILSSNSNSTVNFTAGTKDITCDIPASKQVNRDELGTAAFVATSTFATAAQGAKADSALQSSDIGSSVQAYSATLITWAGITPATGIGTFLATPSSANLRAALTDEVGTGAAYFVGGALGTPASGTLTNCTGLPLLAGVSDRSGPTVQVFTSSGTWTKPTGCVKIKATIVGGGGGGGGVKASSASNCIVAGGGASGGEVITFLDVTAISTLAVTVGAAGAAGTSAGLTGGTGGTSGLGASNANGEATGGVGGGGSITGAVDVYSAQGGSPGAGANGSINGAGNSGGAGIMFAVNQGVSGAGASSSIGGGAAGVRFFANNTGTPGNDASGYGSGGSGAVASKVTTGYAGGAGSAGIVIIEEYYA